MSDLRSKLALHQYYNVPHRTIFCHDNLEVLQGINNECIDLIYLDPPFNKKKTFTAPIGTSAESASFKDIFHQEDLKDEWVRTIKEDHYAIHEVLNAVKNIEGRTSYNYCYLCYMAIRLIECHRILRSTASIYLHCDPTMSHYLKLLMDCIFGEKNFINEIVWCYTGPRKSPKSFGKKHDIVFLYSKNKNSYLFVEQRARHKSGVHNTGQVFGARDEGDYGKKQEMETKGKLLEDWWSDIWATDRYRSERTGYPTQKPTALLERIIKASSNEGDVVLDPFCGCATTCVVAEKLGRRWIGIDISHKAYELVKERLQKEVNDPEHLFNWDKSVLYTTTPPKRTDKDIESRDCKQVYVISHKKWNGEYKVGIATNVKSRLNSYQTGDPNRSFKLEYSIETEHYREMERYIHDRFENKHEWVRGDLSDIIKEMKTYHPMKGSLFDEAEHN